MQPPRITDLNFEDVERGLAEGSMLLIDVREPHEFAAGHIPGAVSVPLSTFDPDALPDPQGRRIVFSCASGNRSAKAAALAQAAGLDLHEHYRGSFKDWLARGGSVEIGE